MHISKKVLKYSTKRTKMLKKHNLIHLASLSIHLNKDPSFFFSQLVPNINLALKITSHINVKQFKWEKKDFKNSNNKIKSPIWLKDRPLS